MFHAWRFQHVFRTLSIILCQACAAKQQVIEPSQVAVTPSAAQQEVVSSQAAIVAPTPSLDHSPTSELVIESYQVIQGINAITGGEISLTAAHGDLIQLSIPQFALSEDAEIRLVAYSNPLDSPFQANTFGSCISCTPDNWLNISSSLKRSSHLLHNSTISPLAG